MSDVTLNAFVASGTKADRVAFTPSPPSPASGPGQGYFFYETDTDNVYTWDGAAWQQVAKKPPLGFVLDGGGATVPTGFVGSFPVTYPGTIVAATVLSMDATPTSGSIVIDVWKKAYGSGYPPTVA